jgi:hypothetical protein
MQNLLATTEVSDLERFRLLVFASSPSLVVTGSTILSGEELTSLLHQGLLRLVSRLELFGVGTAWHLVGQNYNLLPQGIGTTNGASQEVNQVVAGRFTYLPLAVSDTQEIVVGTRHPNFSLGGLL